MVELNIIQIVGYLPHTKGDRKTKGYFTRHKSRLFLLLAASILLTKGNFIHFQTTKKGSVVGTTGFIMVFHL